MHAYIFISHYCSLLKRAYIILKNQLLKAYFKNVLLYVTIMSVGSLFDSLETFVVISIIFFFIISWAVFIFIEDETQDY